MFFFVLTSHPKLTAALFDGCRVCPVPESPDIPRAGGGGGDGALPRRLRAGHAPAHQRRVRLRPAPGALITLTR